MIEYRSVAAERMLSVTRLHSLYYFQLAPNDPLEGEDHDFWEMVYMDAGEADVISETSTQRLRQGELFLHAPNRYHRIRLSPGCAPSIFIISFSCGAEKLMAVAGRIIPLARKQKLLVQQMLNEGAQLYGPLLDCHRDLDAARLSGAQYGCLQMILNHLEILLISLIRTSVETAEPFSDLLTLSDDAEPDTAVHQLMAYMAAHLCDNLTFSDCCAHMRMSGTALKALFRSHRREGVMHCYQRLRVYEARRLLRGGRLNVTQVAQALGYPSCQAFSAQFRRVMGASPTDYVKRVATAPELITSRSEMASRHGKPML